MSENKPSAYLADNYTDTRVFLTLDEAEAWGGKGRTVPLYSEFDAAPKLDKPAKIGKTIFCTGVSWATVVHRAIREYEWDRMQEAGWPR